MCTYHFVATTHTTYYLPVLLEAIGLYHAPKEFLGELLCRGDHKGFVQVARIAGYTAKAPKRGDKRTYQILGPWGALKIVEQRAEDDLGVVCRDIAEVALEGGQILRYKISLAVNGGDIPPQFLKRRDCGEPNCVLSDCYEDEEYGQF